MSREKSPVSDVSDGQGNGFTDGFKSDRSQTSNCVSVYPNGVGQFEGKVGIGDTKDPTGPVLAVPRSALRGLVAFAAGSSERQQ